jgi:hypothetical protein
MRHNACTWRIRHNYELYALYEDIGIMIFRLKGVFVFLEWIYNDQRE